MSRMLARPLSGAIAALALALAVPAHAQPQNAPQEVVRTWFRALAKSDFATALAVTDGPAHEQTRRLVEQIKEGEQHYDCEVEIRMKKLADHLQPPANPFAITVAMDYDIEIAGRKWIFTHVVKRLVGQAQFQVATDSGRITEIKGLFDS